MSRISIFASYGVFATAGSRLRTYGGDGGSCECRYELILCTKVDFPAPAIPMVIITTGFFLFIGDADEPAADVSGSIAVWMVVNKVSVTV